MVNKESIAAKIKEENMTKKESEKIVNEVFAAIKDFVDSGETVNISAFGKFEKRTTKERNARNPQTGEAIVVPPKNKVVFKASKKFSEALN